MMKEILLQLYDNNKIVIVQDEYYFYINLSELSDNPDTITNSQQVKGYLEALMRAEYSSKEDYIKTNKNGDTLAREELFGPIGLASGDYDFSLYLIRLVDKLAKTRESYFSEPKQKKLVKDVNEFLYDSSDGSTAEIEQWHRHNALNATGFRPRMLRSMEGSKSHSGRQRIRENAPHVAASMSVADDLIIQGASPSQALMASKSMQPYFELKSKLNGKS